MRRTLSIIALTTLALAAIVAARPHGATVRFAAYDLMVDTRGASFGAYQVRIESTGAEITLVGVEGGEANSSFVDPPAYDPRALNATERGDRVILAAYTLNAAAPSPVPVRVARVHVQIIGSDEPEWSVTLDAAADAYGTPITPAVSLTPIGDTP